MSPSSPHYVVVIPAYNEAATIADIAARALAHVSHVIVVDDGSSDGTVEAVQDLPIMLLRHERNLGKAATLWRGMQEAIGLGATAVITLDGDGQHEPESIPALLALHRRVPGAIIIGSRLHDAHAIPMARYVANRVANFWLSWASGQPIADSQSGFRLYPAILLSALALACDRTKGFVFESELLIEAGRHGVAIRSVPVSAVYGRHLRRSHFRQVKDIAGITRMVARKLLARRMDLPALVRSRRRPTLAPTAAVMYPPGVEGRTGPRQRLLFFAEAVTLAHVARAVALAQSLDHSRYEIHLACDPRYRTLFSGVPFHLHPIQSIRSEQFQERLATGCPLYTIPELRGYVKEDLRVIADIEPAVVVGDFRLSLSVSARAAAVPYLTVTNAHWSPYARPRVTVPELAITERFGPRIGQVLFSLMRPLVFAHHARALNKVRREHGLPIVGHSLAWMFTEADHTLYADLPEFVPTFGLPAHHHYLGPVLWSAGTKPPWWESLPDDRPLAYVTLGSSGRIDLLPFVLEALEGLGIAVMVSTAGRRFPGTVSSHVWMSEYLPGGEAAAKADLVICNGGSATVYQAIGAGVPVLGIPNNLDQYLMMHYVTDNGLGKIVRAGQVTVAAVTNAARRVLSTPQYRRRAQSLKTLMQSRPMSDRFAALLDDLLVLGRGRVVVPGSTSAGHEEASGFEAPARERNGERMPDARY
ncbi:MAG TPA: glycosyltransferase [Nitrospiraceae bacterium]|nr:glycosyltransferase [Nitrospiraceae bacterium]